MRASRLVPLLSMVCVAVVAPRAGSDPLARYLAPQLPLATTPPPPALREAWDAELQGTLEARVRADRTWRGLVDAARMSVGLVDLRDPVAPRYAALNGDTMMYAASLPKIAILLAAFQAFESRTLSPSPEVYGDLAVMIRRSDNAAATRMVDRIGLETIARTLTAPAVRLYDAASGGGLWVGRAYAQDHPFIGDPLKGLLHAATAYQVCRFYYLLANGRLVSPERSAQMLSLLANTAMGHKFAYHLRDTASLDHVFRKSGTWKDWHADSALVWQDDGRRYILAALVEDSRGEQILRDLLPAAEDVLARLPR
jgi:beta-lactamase class A